MRTISLDASTTHIGWSVWDDDELVDYGLLTPTVKKELFELNDSLASQALRVIAFAFKATPQFSEKSPLHYLFPARVRP